MVVQEMAKKRPASVSEGSQRAAVSVSEMASLCKLSRSRFHALVRAGVFPVPVQPTEGRRPYYTQELLQRCLEIRRTGISNDGRIVLFNRRSERRTPGRQAAGKPDITQHASLVESLKALGLTVTSEAVAAAVRAAFPVGTNGVEDGVVVRRVFLQLQGRRG